MKVAECLFNPKRDIDEVIQEGYLEIRDCLEHGIVPGDMSLADDEEGNGIEDPSKIAGHVHDVFHAERERSRLSKSAAAAAAAPSEPEKVTES